MHKDAHRLIYAADCSFGDCASPQAAWAKADRILNEVLDALSGTGITLKGNTLFRVLGLPALIKIADAGLKIFADYKLFDVIGTCNNDFSWIRLLPIEILTICEPVHPNVVAEAMRKLPDTIVAPVYPLTDLVDSDFRERGEVSRNHAVEKFLKRVHKVHNANGTICSPRDLELAPPGFMNDRAIITPAIRPEWVFLPGDTNAANALTPRRAIQAGATHLVVGSPMRQGGRLRENGMLILNEVSETRREMANVRH